jgi:hypothetical protein
MFSQLWLRRRQILMYGSRRAPPSTPVIPPQVCALEADTLRAALLRLQYPDAPLVSDNDPDLLCMPQPIFERIVLQLMSENCYSYHSPCRAVLPTIQALMRTNRVARARCLDLFLKEKVYPGSWDISRRKDGSAQILQAIIRHSGVRGIVNPDATFSETSSIHYTADYGTDDPPLCFHVELRNTLNSPTLWALSQWVALFAAPRVAFKWENDYRFEIKSYTVEPIISLERRYMSLERHEESMIALFKGLKQYRKELRLRGMVDMNKIQKRTWPLCGD